VKSVAEKMCVLANFSIQGILLKLFPRKCYFQDFAIFMVYTKQNFVGSEPFFSIHISAVMQKDQRTAYTENSITRMWNIQYMTIPKCLGLFAYKDATMPF
jgi:hypothetical protein